MLCFWARHLTRRFRFYVADRWWGQAVYPSWWPSLTKNMQTKHELIRIIIITLKFWPDYFKSTTQWLLCKICNRQKTLNIENNQTNTKVMPKTTFRCWIVIICLKHSTETLNITNSMMRPATVQCCKCVNFTIKFYKMHNNNQIHLNHYLNILSDIKVLTWQLYM